MYQTSEMMMAGPSLVGEEEQENSSLFVYDELFPALPESANSAPATDLGKWNNKMRIGSSVITQVCIVFSGEFTFKRNLSFTEFPFDHGTFNVNFWITRYSVYQQMNVDLTVTTVLVKRNR